MKSPRLPGAGARPRRSTVSTVAAGLALTVLVAADGGCAGAPWFLGEPMDGKSVIPPTSRVRTVADHRRTLDEARRRGEKVIEISALLALEQRGALHADDTRRLIDLLKERARDWIALQRPIPLVADLRHIVALDPSRARPLAVVLRNAARAAGDTWLALGESARAEEEYRQAERLGASGMLYRLRAAWGASPDDLDRPVLAQALAALPARALAPFTVAYLKRVENESVEPSSLLLQRAWVAARVYGPEDLRVRLEALPAPVPVEQVGVPDARSSDAGAPSEPVETPRRLAEQWARVLPVPPPNSAPQIHPDLPEPGPEQRLYAGPTLARTLLPLARLFPGLSAPGARSREWADRLVEEDPTSPDSLELAALVDARAGRADGAARKLMDLVFYSPDRAEGYARAAGVWERAAEGRRACLAWERAAHFGATDDPRWCDLLRCLEANPGAGDPAPVARHVRERAPDLACVP